jgi:perosamine synthetase
MGEGGAITLPESYMAENALKDRWLGIDKGTWARTGQDKTYWWEYNVSKVGLKSHLNDIHASIGLVQLDKLPQLNDRRREINKYYRWELEKYVDLLPEDTLISESSWHFSAIRTKKRDELSVYLKERWINTGVHYKPIHLYPCYGSIPHLPNAEKAFTELLTLPSYPSLTDSEVFYIIDTIKGFFRENTSGL